MEDRLRLDGGWMENEWRMDEEWIENKWRINESKELLQEERNLIDLLKLEVSSKKDPLGLEGGGPGRGSRACFRNRWEDVIS